MSTATTVRSEAAAIPALAGLVHRSSPVVCRAAASPVVANSVPLTSISIRNPREPTELKWEPLPSDRRTIAMPHIPAHVRRGKLVIVAHESYVYPSRRQAPEKSRRGLLLAIIVLLVLVFSARRSISYYVDSLWFSSLGYSDVFWRVLELKWAAV